MKWFRFYAEVLHDPKVQKLTAQLFKDWVNVLCCAAERDGMLPKSVSDLAFLLRTTEQRAEKTIFDLVSNGLLDVSEAGYSPHNWNARQYRSDVSTERVKRYRKRRGNVSETVSETPPDTDTDTDTETDTYTHTEMRVFQTSENGSKTKPERQSKFDELFQELKRLCESTNCPIHGDPGSWRRAWFAWSHLDPEQKVKAIQCIRDRIEHCAWGDPIMKSLPHNYLADQKFERPKALNNNVNAAQERLRNA